MALPTTPNQPNKKSGGLPTGPTGGLPTAPTTPAKPSGLPTAPTRPSSGLPTAPTKPQIPTRPNIPSVDKNSGGDITEAQLIERIEQRTYLQDFEEQVPKRNLEYNINAKNEGVYRSLSKDIGSEEILNEDYEAKYRHLEPIIVQTVNWVQETMNDRDMSKDVAKAREKRGKDLEEMRMKIDKLLLRYFDSTRELELSPAHYGIVSAFVINELLGLGPIEPLWEDSRITEIMVNGPNEVRVEIGGKIIVATGAKFRDKEHLIDTVNRILQPLNKSLDNAHPEQDGRLYDGSRLHALHPAVVPSGPIITIRRFPETVFSVKTLVDFGAMTPEIAATVGWLIHSGCSTIVAGGTGSGKDLSLDTLIPTPFGMRRMGDLKVGDNVLDENSQPTTITGYFPQPLNDCYKVVFSDGTEVIAGATHNWFTATALDLRNAVQHRVIASKAELKALNRIKSSYMLTTEALVLENTPRLGATITEAAKRVNPIVVNGKTHYRTTELTRAIKDSLHTNNTPVGAVRTTLQLIDDLRTATDQPNQFVQVTSQHVEYPHAELSVDPYTLGVQLGSGELSALPNEYLISLKKQRLDLLSGLADSSGTVDENSGVITITLHENARDDIRQVLHSLGLQTFTGGSNGSVSFMSKDSVFVAKHESNAIHAQAMKTNELPKYRHIVDIVPVESVPTACISVDSPNSLYLCSDAFIVTHNTSMLNALSGCIPLEDRIISIEDNLELRLNAQRHWIPLETRVSPHGDTQANKDIRALVKASLRMRPDRIVVGEVRDEAAYDMLQAMNTGHEGSMTTVHSNDPNATVTRLVNLVTQSKEMDSQQAASLIANSVDLFVNIARYEDGSRRISHISEIPSTIEDPIKGLLPRTLWEFRQTGTEKYLDDKGRQLERVVGEYVKVNDISTDLIKRHRLDHKPRLTVEDVYRMSSQEGEVVDINEEMIETAAKAPQLMEIDLESEQDHYDAPEVEQIAQAAAVAPTPNIVEEPVFEAPQEVHAEPVMKPAFEAPEEAYVEPIVEPAFEAPQEVYVEPVEEPAFEAPQPVRVEPDPVEEEVKGNAFLAELVKLAEEEGQRPPSS